MRKGDWFLTSTGRQFWPLDPRPEDICIEDIAHGLAHVCRFGGHCKRFYSVAQHSVFVSYRCRNALQGLLHDATEAYLGDMVRPLKYSMPDYLVAEERVWRAVCARFGLPLKLDADVKYADNVALMTERRDIMPWTPHRWEADLEAIAPDPRPLRCGWWARYRAKENFLRRYYELTAASRLKQITLTESLYEPC